MWLYLLKSTACLAILLLFYKFFLERESIHVFKRFYLLGALAFSMVVPELVFTEEVVVIYPSVETETPSVVYAHIDNVPNVPQKLEADITDFSPLLWGGYFLGLAFFGMRFFKNLAQIVRRIQSNPKERVAAFIRVLLGENIPPHTFFSYIFLNKGKLESNNIPEEVLLHEETHARQKHSIDVLLIEILQVIFWFNPLIYVLRKSIKLNHEFLADSAVLKKGVASSTYQNTLLSFMTPAGNQAFINAINYSSIKKRFTVMKKNTSKRTAFLKSLLLLPLLTVLLFSFTETKIVYRSADIDEATVSEVADTNDTKVISASKVNDRVKREEVTGMTPLVHHEAGLAISTIPNDISKEHQEGASPEELVQYASLAEKYNAQPIESRTVPLKDLRTLETLYRKMSEEQKKSALPFPECQEIENLHIYIQDNEQLLVNGEMVKLDELAVLLPKFNAQITRAERQNKVRSYIKAEKNTPVSTLEKIEAALTSYGVATIDIMGPKEKTGSSLQQSGARQSEEKELFVIIADQKITLNGKSVTLERFAKEVDALTADWEETDYTSASTQVQIRNASSNFLKKVDREFKKTHFSKANGGTGLVPPPPPPPTSPQIENHIALHPPTPPVAVSAAVVEEIVENQEVHSVQEVVEHQEAHAVQEIVENQVVHSVQEVFSEPVPVAPPVFTDTNDEREDYLKNPPAPPEPQSPLDHVIEMAKEGATFYYEGKEISSDKAVELLKKNHNLNIDSRGAGSKNPVVRISRHPIKI